MAVSTRLVKSNNSAMMLQRVTIEYYDSDSDDSSSGYDSDSDGDSTASDDTSLSSGSFDSSDSGDTCSSFDSLDSDDHYSSDDSGSDGGSDSDSGHSNSPTMDGPTADAPSSMEELQVLWTFFSQGETLLVSLPEQEWASPRDRTVSWIQGLLTGGMSPLCDGEEAEKGGEQEGIGNEGGLGHSELPSLKRKREDDEDEGQSPPKRRFETVSG
ncbi:hypothetical protein BJX99DRAFT_219612 [Aspergillus californicus]